jgi:hypothetical protein
MKLCPHEEHNLFFSLFITVSPFIVVDSFVIVPSFVVGSFVVTDVMSTFSARLCVETGLSRGSHMERKSHS